MSRKEKGAIQLSLGFIVTVVFAVVLLSLAIMWVRDLFIDVDLVVQDLTRQAQEELGKVFSETTSNFAVRPSKPEVNRGTKLILQGGLKNNDPSGTSLYYVINVKAANTNTNTDLATMDSWITQSTETFAGPNNIAYRDVIISIPTNAEAGAYMYDVFACSGASSGMSVSGCVISSSNLWGTPQTLTIIVKST